MKRRIQGREVLVCVLEGGVTPPPHLMRLPRMKSGLGRGGEAHNNLTR